MNPNENIRFFRGDKKMSIQKNGLTLNVSERGDLVCEEMRELPQAFQAEYSTEVIQEHIEGLLTLLREGASDRTVDLEESESDQKKAERKVLGQQKFDAVVEELKAQTKELNLFQTFLFWFGPWWYYHPSLTGKVSFSREGDGFYFLDYVQNTISTLMYKVLPVPVQKELKDMEAAAVATGFGHFAVLYRKEGSDIRRIITDTQLFEIRGVSGYVYLDVTQDGKPVARSRCQRGGERAFFDGVRLMSHGKFQTCAPKTVIVDGGYKVNSTLCTIVNGMLFDLIDLEDKVAHTTGAFFGITEFSGKQLAEACKLAQNSGEKMQVRDSRVCYDGKELKPIGIFTPSCKQILDSGFTHYEWSTFHEARTICFESVLVVDDKQEWIDMVVAEFEGEIKRLEGFCTTNAEEALAKILDSKPSVVLLDIHLSPDERFEGLWIANQLAARGYSGVIMITSSYDEKNLCAMQRLIKVKTQAPGKDLEKIRLALTSKAK